MQFEYRAPRGEQDVERHAVERRRPRVERLQRARARQPENARLGVRIGVIDAHVHQEAIELGFRQRKRAFLLDGVLGRHDQEQLRQAIGLAADGHLALAHRFQKRGLDLRRGAVDLIGQQQRMEDRPRLEFETTILRSPDFGAGQIGREQIGRELHTREVRIQPLGERADGRGLGQPGRPFNQQMAIRQQRDQQPFHQRRLPEDRLRKRLAQRSEAPLQTIRRPGALLHPRSCPRRPTRQAEFDRKRPPLFRLPGRAGTGARPETRTGPDRVPF